MGRPKEHTEQTALALLAAAESIIEADGVEALSLRRVAAQVPTTTRAVYSLFGSKEGLVVALGIRAQQLLGRAIRVLPRSDDAAQDLVDAGVTVFRSFVVSHPSLFRVGIQMPMPAIEPSGQFREEGAAAWARLGALVARLENGGGLGGRQIDEASLQFHALCEGLAMLELRGLLPAGQEEDFWRAALRALVTGFAAPAGRDTEARASRQSDRHPGTKAPKVSSA
jgi:AcrR family transcriptional regulator